MDNRTGLQEGFLNILGRFRGRLHENEAVFAGEHLTFVRADLSTSVQVTLIPDEHDRHVRVAILFDFLEPAGQVRESVAPRDVIDEQGTGCAAVVRSRDALEGLLARRVPDLQLDVLLLDLDCAGAELDTDGQVVLLAEPLVRELEQQAGLSDT